MRFSPLGLSAILLGITSAIELTVYNNVDDCNADSYTVYRIFSDPVPGTCYYFDSNSAGEYDIPCSEYKEGGISNGPCQAETLYPRSGLLKPYEGGWCTLWTEDDCSGSSSENRGYTEISCFSPNIGDEYKSFRCGPTG